VRHRAAALPPGRHGRTGAGARLAAAASVALMLASAVTLGSVLAALSGPSTGVAPPAVAALPRSDPGPSGPSETPASPHRPGAQGSGAAVSAVRHWRTVLARLDRRRAQAYAAAEPGLLRSVYLPRSAVLRRDRRLLTGYARRGLRVRGLRMQVADLRVRTARPGRVVLLVRDRVGGGVVLGHGRRRALPADDLDRRVLALRRVDRRGWLVAAVRAAPH
jgi:hypothetical protein